ncbi:cyclase family protein [Arenibaculum pallidiluteum]|uniref:cyclase family protein n=1 Tax=Arenibaculum pallidiluteum TaxID=2812559 RepID=UPI001A969185|nr:cyclase family protein [Arenibaculum pallidiluteum]
MCVPGCQEALARRLSRRTFFGGAAAVAGVATLPVTSAAVAAPMRFERAVDLTHPLGPDFPTFGGTPGIAVKKKYDLAKDGYNLNEWVIEEHTGTHMDAPLHFTKDGLSADALGVDKLVVPLAVIDVTAKAASNPDYQVRVEDIAAYEREHGALPAGACVAMRSGWDKHVSGPKFRNADGAGVMHFPGFHPEVARALLGRNVSGVAVDTLSLDHGASKDFAFHLTWLGGGRWGLEGVANLDQVPASGATLVVGGPKIKGATGGPSRLIALV